jgi:cytidine deaminase
VTTKVDIPSTPCGACCQVIQEFSTPNTVVIHKTSTGYVAIPISQMLPFAFTEFVAIDQDGSTKRIQKGA